MLQKILRPFEMVASGIFQNENGLIYEAPTTNYMDLEYYRGELDGKKQILKAFRDFYMNKLNVIDLTNTYHLTKKLKSQIIHSSKIIKNGVFLTN